MRQELFGVERLEAHARSLAAAQQVTHRPPAVPSLRIRLAENARVLLAAYRASAAELEAGRRVVPAAEWLLDNYHVVEQQTRDIRTDLPANYYRQLPKLATGPFAGYPRVFGLAWAFVAHTDSHVDTGMLRGFLNAYQQVQPLTIGELWAVSITLRIVLIENLRRLTDQITVGRAERVDADRLADALTGSGSSAAALATDIEARSPRALSELFAAQLAKRLRDRDPRTTAGLDWLEDRLQHQGVSIDAVVLHAQQRQGASNVSARNVVTSLRLMADIDWADLFESVSLVDARLCTASGFATMDFATRNLYRNAIEQLARRAPCSELDIADHVLAAAQAAVADPAHAHEQTRVGDPGYHLIAQGRPALEATIGFRPPITLRLGRWQARMGIRAYVGAIVLGAGVLLALALWWLHGSSGDGGSGGDGGMAIGALALWTVAMLLPASELATALFQRVVARCFGAVALPGLELAGGVPTALRTVVAVPTLLSTEAELREQIERLEVHHLACGSGDMVFALLTDGLDADTEELPTDAPLLALARGAIAELNLRHGPAPAGARFLLLHRRRIFNSAEGRWMGWERKRGKLHELNRLLRGATDTSFVAEAGTVLEVPQDVRYVLTLDADTRLPRDVALRLVGKMAHPLNHPRFDTTLQRVVAGYAVLQPRITPALPVGREGSLYQRVTSAPAGMDPYAMAISDVYQDLFGEGSYTGKGIYDIDAFEASLHARVPDNTLLSHDLFEGVFARAGLASDVELVEESPSRYDVAARRQHRWMRGDWQLLPWIFGHRSGAAALPTIGRWKMLDNLRRSLLAPSTLLALVASWLLPGTMAPLAVLLVIATLAVPAMLPAFFAILPRRGGLYLRNHLQGLGSDLRLAMAQTLLALAFLADQAWRAGDAICRTLLRLLITRRHLLEWTTAAQSGQRPRLDVWGFYRQMAGGTALGLLLGGAVLARVQAAWPVVLPLVLLWLLAPLLALWASRPPAVMRGQQLTPDDARALRLIARRTWRYFETFVVAADSMLPPDNFQETPRPVVARRTSPTNIGLYLLASATARDFGWAGTHDTVARLEATFATLHRLARFKGHFYNWYATDDGHALEPRYVSSVDSGNLAGHLLALANACEEWRDTAPSAVARTGMVDALDLALQALAGLAVAASPRGLRVRILLEDMGTQLAGTQAIEVIAPVLRRLAGKAAIAARGLDQGDEPQADDLVFWIEALGRTATAHARDAQDAGEAQAQALTARLQVLADTARSMARDMDFAFLIDPERKLLSIGYAVAEQRLDANCYDLLASEARLASLFAIAKGDAPTRHWFRLGRAATPLGSGSALISWSGSMFECLMPSLVMRAPVGSLLEQTSRLVVQRQVAYGHARGIPWGISESAYNARDLEYTYQYSNFGVPGLGLKRGLADNLVMAPYATALAAMVDAPAACRNFERLDTMGALGRHGFYEALDFTATRLPEGDNMAIVRCYMAHHQGMAIVAIANVLQQGCMRSRFHREPMVQACELLLQERMPRHVAVETPRAEEVHASRDHGGSAAPHVRRVAARGPVPVTQLLSNGRYSVMLTATGAGYSRWQGLAITRWRSDVTRDPWGAFLYLRDTQGGRAWSACAQPLSPNESGEVLFSEDRATYTLRHAGLDTTLDVLVSGEADGEVRRLAITNEGRAAREIEVTSYAEVVLAAQAADEAHPAFSKLFVQTEYLAEFGALVATRRRRAPDEPTVWAAHFAVVEGKVTAAPQYESDRARFLGRGRDAATATAITDGQALSGTVGTVLDPVFSLRQRVRIPPGGVVRIAFWTLVAPTRAGLLDLIDQHHDRSAFDRVATLAWTQAQVQLRHLSVGTDEAADFQRLAAPLLYTDRRLRAAPEALLRGAGPQSGLWPHGVSGDLPIVLLRIDDIEDLAQVRQMLRAHEYWRMKLLGVDLVILNERASSYVQDLHIAIEAAVRSSQARPRLDSGLAQGTVHVLRADLLGVGVRALLQAAAHLELVARHGSIAEWLARRLPDVAPVAATPSASPMSAAAAATLSALPTPYMSPAPAASSASPASPLEFFNGIGGFDSDGREYVVQLQSGETTPAPWINVIANPGFGFQVSADGSGNTWSENSRENQLTPWSNDPVSDPGGEAFYLRDEDTGAVWTPTALPMRGDGRYEARHGFGYSRFTHTAHGITTELLQYVPLQDPVKISRLRIVNRSDQTRRLSVTAYAEWVLGTSRGASAPFIVTEADPASGALLARKPWNIAFPGRVAFADLGGRQSAWTADRTEFLGRNGSPAAPAALAGDHALSGATGAGLDPCAALQCELTLAPGASVEVVALLGQASSTEQAQALIARYRAADLDTVLDEVGADWKTMLGAVQVHTPDRAMDILLNGWLLYQAVACRLWARSAFYQSSGAYGFRDQLQDGMALAFTAPAQTREHLLRAAGRQFVQGDVQHWWLPHSGQGVRTRISDDRVWLAYAAASYVGSSGDTAVLDEMLPFIEGPALGPNEHDAFFQPMPASESASLFEHCARGLDQCLELTGAHGLPLMGTGDWNDGMNRVGAGGQGESVWLGWLLLRTITLFAPLAEGRDPARAQRWRDHADALRTAMERDAWDGAWYRRATFDDGTWLGTHTGEACRIDAIAQAWAVLSGAADPARATQAMASLAEHLIRPDDGLALLLAPPFDHSAPDPGYIQGYPPGLRENGGQYSHAAMWAILAFAQLGDGDRAAALFSLVNPISHARTRAQAERYKLEPYVVAADVYSVAPHTGRGGWSWYTGSAAWMYRAGIEGILGLRREGAWLTLAPALPSDWPGFEMHVAVGATVYGIRVQRASAPGTTTHTAALDGQPLAMDGQVVRLALDGGTHALVLELPADQAG